PDLDDAIAERADVRDDVHVARADVRGAVIDVLDGAIGITKLCLQPLRASHVALGDQRSESVLVVLTLLLQARTLPLHLLLCAALLAQPLLLLTLPLL